MVTLAPELPGALDVVRGARRERRRRVRGPQRRDLGAGAGGLRRRHPERDPPVQRDGAARPPRARARRAPRWPTIGSRSGSSPTGSTSTRAWSRWSGGRSGRSAWPSSPTRSGRSASRPGATAWPAATSIVDATSCRLPDGDARRQPHRARRRRAQPRRVRGLLDRGGARWRRRVVPARLLGLDWPLADEPARRDPRAAGRGAAPAARVAGRPRGASRPASGPSRSTPSSSRRAGRRDHAAIYAQYLLGVRNGLSVGLATPSVVSLYGAELALARLAGHRDQPVGRVAGHRRGRRGGGPPGRADARDHERPRRARSPRRPTTSSTSPPARSGPSRRPRPTRRRCSRSPGCRSRCDPDPVADRQRWPRSPRRWPPRSPSRPTSRRSAAELAAATGSFDRCVVVGRGFEYATAREWALKLKELGQVFADPYSAADFRHGPIALVQPGIPVLVLAPEGEAAAGQVELLARPARPGRRHRRRRPTWPRRATSAAGPSRFPRACRSGSARSSRSSRRSSSPTT